jgi:hypothetical protein
LEPPFGGHDLGRRTLQEDGRSVEEGRHYGLEVGLILQEEATWPGVGVVPVEWAVGIQDLREVPSLKARRATSLVRWRPVRGLVCVGEPRTELTEAGMGRGPCGRSEGIEGVVMSQFG